MTSWLTDAVFYEVYPQSFQDSNADGIGDFNGIIARLDYIRDLGCNGFGVLRRVIWPLSLPGVISGVIMVLIPSISTFYISQKLGNGKFYLIGDAIEGQYVANNLHFAAAIAFILMVILLVCMAFMQRYANKKAVAA